ncbi:MAG: hypothetical protein HQM01_02050 [Magnetococcales bacterium]|nr:hypothetical protein [Magnetococcales bacterium]
MIKFPQKKPVDLGGRMESDARLFARFIAFRHTTPPLAISLLAEWGHGKSFFMRLVQSEVKNISDLARKNQRGEPIQDDWDNRTFGSIKEYYPEIVHIEFNAWHYAEENLLASLVIEIFSQVKKHISKKNKPELEEDLLNKHSRLLEEKKNAEQVLQDEIHRHENALTVEKDAEQKFLDVQERVQNSKSNMPDAKSVVKLVADSVMNDPDTIQELKKIGIHDKIVEISNKVEEILLMRQQMNGLFHDWVDTIQLLKRMPSFWLAIILLPLFFPSVLTFLLNKLILNDWIHNAFNTILEYVFIPASAIILFVINKGRLIHSVLRSSVDKVVKVQKDQALNHEETLTAQKEFIQKKNQREQAFEKLQHCRNTLEEIKRQIERTNQEMEASLPSNQLLKLVDDISADVDYQKALTMITRIRKDLGKLEEILNKPMPIGEKGKEHHFVNRVVLYIDDLDRCPAPRVVEVLQAINMLLSFRLFVVMVAVDPRWLSRSLALHYPQLLTNAEHTDTPSPGDYLEKIFQISYHIPPMGHDVTASFLDALFNKEKNPDQNNSPTTDNPSGSPDDSLAKDQNVDDQSHDSSPNRPENQGDSSGASNTGFDKTQIGNNGASSSTTDQSRDQNDTDPFRNSLILSTAEVLLIKKFGACLVASPRQILQLVNVYRLIKAKALTNHPDEKGKEAYDTETIVFLLAVTLTSSAVEFFKDLEEAATDENRQDDDLLLLEELISGKESRGKRNDVELKNLFNNWKGKLPDLFQCVAHVRCFSPHLMWREADQMTTEGAKV